jgi:rhodanese-related sulfurtransferase
VEPSELEKRIAKRMNEAGPPKNPSAVWMVLHYVWMRLYRGITGRWRLPAVSEIGVDELRRRLQTGPIPHLIDVNFAGEFNQGYGHIPASRSIPIGQFDPSLEELQPFKEEEIVTICPGGGMSLIAAEMLAEAGFKDVKSLRGGSDLWFKKGYPTTRS